MTGATRTETEVSLRAAALNDPASDARFRILRLLEADPNLSQRELADALGVSVGKANYSLQALVDKGFVKLQNFRSSRNKLRYAYVLTPAGLAEKAALTAGFLRRKTAEYEALRTEIEAVTTEAQLAAAKGPPEGRG